MLTSFFIFLVIAAIAAAWLYAHGTLPLPRRHQSMQYRRMMSARRLSWGGLLVDVSGTLTDTRLTAQKASTVETDEHFALAAATVIQKGQMVGLDVNGNIVPANSAACVRVLGAANHAVDNSTPPSGWATNQYGLTGLAGQGSLKVDYGVNCWANAAGTGKITAAMAGQPCWVSDDQTVSALESAGLPAGVICGVGDEKGGGDGQVHVLQGPHGVALATALALAQGEVTAMPFKARAVVTTLQAYTGSGTGTLTETANGAISAADGVTLAVGDVVFIQEGTTNLTAAKDAGPWVVSALGGASAKWVLVRPSWWLNGAAIPQGVIIDVGGEGTAMAGTQWKTFCTGGKVVGTDAPIFWPKQIQGSTALVAGTFTISAAIRSATLSQVDLVRIVANTSTATTGGYNPTSGGANGITAGVLGTGQAIVQACVAAGTINNADISTLAWSVQNW